MLSLEILAQMRGVQVPAAAGLRQGGVLAVLQGRDAGFAVHGCVGRVAQADAQGPGGSGR